MRGSLFAIIVGIPRLIVKRFIFAQNENRFIFAQNENRLTFFVSRGYMFLSNAKEEALCFLCMSGLKS